MIEQILSPENMRKALLRVEANKGAAGIDGIEVKGLSAYLVANWPSVKQAILKGAYQPRAVRRVSIPKASGGVRLLGIPTVLDRLIQQAVLQVLTPVFDPGFSESSYGFRPKRRGHDAVRQARSYIEQSYRIVVDLDLEQFFDRINHDMLMSRVARKVKDKKVLKLLRAYLNSGVMIDGVRVEQADGTPQGGPLSPLLANIFLDDLDKELEKRGLRFCRYADDCNIYVKSKRAGERVKQSITRFLQDKLKLRVNESKSAVDWSWKRKFLGFSVTTDKQPKIRIAKKSIDRVKDTIRKLTKSSQSMGMEERIAGLCEYLSGWMGYFALCETPSVFKALDEWTRRRLRLCQWTQWKRPKTKYRELIKLGLNHEQVRQTANTRRGNWRTVHTVLIHKTLGTAYWQDQGFKSLLECYNEFRKDWRTAVCRTARTVV
jgi:RNA-directed DNA polymerase